MHAINKLRGIPIVFKDDHLNDISPGAFDDLMKIENAIPAASGFAISFK